MSARNSWAERILSVGLLLILFFPYSVCFFPKNSDIHGLKYLQILSNNNRFDNRRLTRKLMGIQANQNNSIETNIPTRILPGSDAAEDFTRLEFYQEESIMDENIRSAVDSMIANEKKNHQTEEAIRPPEEIIKNLLTDKSQRPLLQNTTKVMEMLFGDTGYQKDPFDEVSDSSLQICSSLLMILNDIK